MPDVNTGKSTSPPNGGNVEEPNKTTPQIQSDVVRVTPVSKSSNNQTINHTEFGYLTLPAESHLKTQQDVDPDGGKLDPSTQMQTDTNVKEVNTCSIESTSQTDRNHVIRRLGVTSTAFIGPACRPEPGIEQELCEFYKELEEVDKVDGDSDTKSVEEHGLHSSLKPKSSPVVRTDHGRAYRPYPDPHECNQKDPKRWRPRLQWNTDDFGGRGHPEPRYPPPPWVPPVPRVQFFPPPTSGCPIMFPPDMRPQENFHKNNSWGPWEGPPLPSNRWHEHHSFQSQEDHRFSEEYETPLSHWQQQDHEKDQYQHLELILLRGVPGSGKSTLAR